MQILVAVFYDGDGQRRENIGLYETPDYLMADLFRQEYFLNDRGEDQFDLVMESTLGTEIFCSEKMMIRRDGYMILCRQAFRDKQEMLRREETAKNMKSIHELLKGNATSKSAI